ncbi:MAG: sugar phosphate nucleotidyltransferase [Kiritimatiellae bacterium]|nr:sugar phosphate nucleotidyltransferase [Kiritimatiellia bacterium]MCO5061303.1 sugar phosphate nucleotidyltransferase [Kiritimatiellia bacterium]MCO6400187.1 mannose-1-phosphate guanylyltransferase [Verrucomicrobiota bacterium]
MGDHRYAVILAGGRGERFWPLSRAARPKQLLALVGNRPLLAQAVGRLEGLIPPERVLVLTNADLVQASREAAPELPPANIIGEPVGRDTAPAVALATALVKARDPKGVFAILTADHVMGDLPHFRETLAAGMDIAESGDYLVTIGIQPNEPSTGFGYIEQGDDFSTVRGIPFKRVRRFVEKPDRSTAESYLASGRFAWNSGMFVWSVPSIQSALQKYHPELGSKIDEWALAAVQPNFAEQLAESFATVRKISIDYAVMEKADNIVVAAGTFAWDDVGSWPALERHFPADHAQNVLIGDATAVASAQNIVYSQGRLTALVGVKDLIVVQAEDATLVCHRDHAQNIKELLATLREAGRTEVL